MAQHVLLVEDEPNIAEAIRFILTRDGWRVSHVADGLAALVRAAGVQLDPLPAREEEPALPAR